MLLTKGEMKILVIAIAILAIFLISFPLFVMAIETKVGDIQTTKHTTDVYASYQPGNLGNHVCTLPKGEEVEILEILTSNDLPNHEKGMFTEIKAFRIKASECTGWVVPDDID